jgi:signal transduction histidine kinase
MNRLTEILSVSLLLLFPVLTFSAEPGGSTLHAKVITPPEPISVASRDSIIITYKEVTAKAEQSHTVNDQIAELWVRISRYLYYRGNTEEAIRYSLKALDYANLKGLPRLKISMQLLTGDILRGNNLYDLSFSYLNQALIASAALRDTFLMAGAFDRLAAVYLEKYDFNVTEQHARVALYLARSIQCDSITYSSLNILGVGESFKNNPGASLYFLQQALPIAKHVRSDDVSLILINIARNYRLFPDERLAERYSLEAMEQAVRDSIPQYIRLAALNLKLIYKSRNDFRNALQYDSLYYQAKESIRTQNLQIQLKEFTRRIEAERQQGLTQRLLLEKKLTENRFLFSLVTGFLLFAVLLVLIGFLIQFRHQRNQIRKIASDLDQSNLFLKKFISILAHDLRSPFNTILGYSSLLRDDPDMDQEDQKTAVKALCRVSESTFHLLERLLEWSQMQAGTLQPEKQPADIMELIMEERASQEPAARLKGIRLTGNEMTGLILSIDKEMIRTTIRNLLSNALKFARPGGEVSVRLSKSAQEARIEISDNGVGIPEERIKKLMHSGEIFSSQGTKGEKGTGLGLTLCREYIRLHGGDLHIESKVNHGSTFSVILPLS